MAVLTLGCTITEAACPPGEQLSSVPLDVMEEVVVEPGASSASAAADSDDSLSQPSSIALVESIDEALVPDIIAGTTTLVLWYTLLCIQRSVHPSFQTLLSESLPIRCPKVLRLCRLWKKRRT